MSEKRNKTHLHCTVNGKERDDFVKDNLLLADYLREELGLTGTKIGCDGGECGCCTVLIDGVPQHACLRLAATCQEVEIETIETISEESRLSALQRGFHEKLGTQCGFCTPGMIMAAEGLLRQNSNPTVDQIRRGLASNICRCTGYIKIIESVQFAVEELNSRGKAA
ncbi:MAG: 2Fe-2S iron-sulfur cluster-binding protein [Rhodospirillales bacterium]|jgi:4-hydroxybenzoyl-CoA reductase subunit gamma